MSAQDKYHDLVKEALQLDGWVITDDPLKLKVGKRNLKIDLGAERILGAEKGNDKIAVEIKSFLGPSLLTEFYQALGQYNVYNLALETIEADRVLFLAVPYEIYQDFLQEFLALEAIERYKVRLLVYHIDQANIALWKK